MFLSRHITEKLKRLSQQYPIVTLMGPRQSGKTTLSKHLFSDYRYISLEDPDMRDFALSDPRGFLAMYSGQVIIDEVQRVPDLFSYLQTNVDLDPTPGRFILTGSEYFAVSHNVSQSLAGRTALLRLLPLSFSELSRCSVQTVWHENMLRPMKDQQVPTSFPDVLFKGMYPRIHDRQLDPQQFYRDYLDTYLTKDVRELLAVEDIRRFHHCLMLLAGRSGQILNLSELGGLVGVSHSTISRWVALLEASFIIYLLPPFHKNYNKRIVKSPKIYFLDTGLMCHLLKLRAPEEVPLHNAYGGIVETSVVSEIVKHFFNQGEKVPLYFWRDQSGREVDLLIDLGNQIIPIEIKAGATYTSSWAKNIREWLTLSGQAEQDGFVVYGGSQYFVRDGIQILPWFEVS